MFNLHFNLDMALVNHPFASGTLFGIQSKGQATSKQIFFFSRPQRSEENDWQVWADRKGSVTQWELLSNCAEQKSILELNKEWNLKPSALQYQKTTSISQEQEPELTVGTKRINACIHWHVKSENKCCWHSFRMLLKCSKKIQVWSTTFVLERSFQHHF